MTVNVSYVWTMGGEVPHVVKGTPEEVNEAIQRGTHDYAWYERNQNGEGIAGKMLTPGFTALEGVHGEPVFIRGSLVTSITTQADLPW